MFYLTCDARDTSARRQTDYETDRESKRAKESKREREKDRERKREKEKREKERESEKDSKRERKKERQGEIGRNYQKSPTYLQKSPIGHKKRPRSSKRIFQRLLCEQQQQQTAIISSKEPYVAAKDT